MRPTLPLAALLLTAATLPAQQTTTHLPHPPADPAAVRSTSLPVTRISLYKNGVGYFEHTGFVSGNASVTLDFTSGQLNDVLQSLTAIDLGGGRISGAGYNSTTPLDQQLKALSLGLGQKTTFSGLFTALRGTRVQVTGSGPAFTGRLVDIEMHKTSPGPNQSKDAAGMTEGRFLTVASESGDVRIFQLTPALTVRLLDTSAHTDLNQYLQLLDENRNQGLRHLTLLDLAPSNPTTAQRTLQLSYISEVPIWKSTYRILFTDDSPGGPFTRSSLRVSGEPQPPAAEQTATLQGWSVVDNTTRVDWINVHLSLIAGAPQSFIQPLSQPIYSSRPEIPIAQDAQLQPQTFESGEDKRDRFSGGGLESLAAPPPPPTPQSLAMKSRSASNFMALQPGVANGTGVGAGMDSNAGGGVYHGWLAPEPTVSYEDAAATSLTPTATSAAFDDYFAYNLTEPVTIRKNESALVPILQAKVTADRVTLVSSDGTSVRQPLRALWITNTSGLTLDRGSFTLIENGSFGGEGLLDPIHAGEKRLLSYAADQAIHVTVEGGGPSVDRVDHITASKGVLVLHKAQIVTTTYTIHNAAPDARTVVLEHPIRPGYTLTSATKPDETTATVDRFRLPTAPGQTLKLELTAKHRGVTTYQLTNSNENQLSLILKQGSSDPKLAAALQPILEARRRVADAQTAVDQTNATLKNLRADEDRQRSNITALATADKSSRDRFVRDLNQTEDKITAAQTELTTRTADLDAAKADLANRIESLQIDDKL
jgi:hypothetical protein